MLGYLSLEDDQDPDEYKIDGLDLDKHYNYYPIDQNKRWLSPIRWIKRPQPKRIRPRPMSDVLQASKRGRIWRKILGRGAVRFPGDPPHTFKHTSTQIRWADNPYDSDDPIPNANFVKNFIDTQFYKFNKFQKRNPDAVMGYYTAKEVPVYDYIKKNFFVCDHWWVTA